MEDNEFEIRKFLNIKEANGQSEYTIKSQQTILAKLNTFLNGKPFREVTQDEIVAFVSEMNRKYAESYVGLAKIVIKSFYRQLYGMKRHEFPPQVVNLNSNYNHKKRLPIRPEDIITKEDLVEFVRWCDNFRDKAMVVTLYESAARIGEFAKINIEQLKFDEKGAVLVIEGKTGQRRLRLIESVPFLQKWIESHPRKGEDLAPLWCSVRKPFGRVSGGAIRLVLLKIRNRGGIKKPMNPHNFRHSRLTELAKFLSDSKLKIFAGWTANSDMAGVYVHLTGKDLDDDLLKIAGVETEEKPQVSPLLEINCPRCGTKNQCNNTFCGLCGLVLDETKAVSEELDREKLKSEIEDLKERSEVACMHNCAKRVFRGRKSYNAIKSSRYFPKEDVLLLGGLSPKSLIHEHGVLMDANNHPIVPDDKPVKPRRSLFSRGDSGTDEYNQALENYRTEFNVWNERNRSSYKLIRLQNKILIFLEAPPQETIRMLLPILSHDTRRIEYKYVEEMETKTAIIEGWPAAIFLSTDTQYMEELSTRTLTATPESGVDKIEEANKLTNIQAAYPWEYEEDTESTRIIREIILRIKDKLVTGNLGIVVPFANLYKMFPKEIVRDMRDFKHFVQFLKALTSAHIFQRPILRIREKSHVLTSIDDVVLALCIYSKIFETTRTGTEESVLKFYHEIVKTREAWLKKELVTEYNKSHKKKVSGDTIGWWLRRLSVIGYVNITKSKLDKRANLYEPLVKEEEKHEIVRVLEDREVLRSKLEKGFENWLEKNVEKKEFFQYEISDGDMILKEIDLDFVKDNIKESSFRNIPSNFHSIYTELSLLKSEKQPENTREVENRTFSDNLRKEDWKDRCPICSSDIREGQERVRLAPWMDGINAHKACIKMIDMHFSGERIYHKDKTWREYACMLSSSSEYYSLLSLKQAIKEPVKCMCAYKFISNSKVSTLELVF